MAESNSLPDLLQDLRAALEAERKALLSGNPARVDAAVACKLALADAVERATPAGLRPEVADRTLMELARYNRENHVICSAILRHVTAALDRLRQREPHRSYGPDGSEQNPPNQRFVGAA
ncbi:MAG: hypothetical protein ACREFD_02230 [Stellaceae bacterium]